MTPRLFTPVDIPAMPLRISHDDSIVSIGSCFADEMATRLAEGGFQVEQNPFGTLYNPASVALGLQRLIDNREIGIADLVQHEGLWHSWYHHGSFSHASQKECLEACNSRIREAHHTLKEANLLIVTLGTAYIFEHEGLVVSNCHKLPPQQFTRRMMTTSEIVALWQPLTDRLHTFNHGLSIIFTVSPIRHMADGAHGNNMSKATLLLAIDQLINTPLPTPSYYFPAYEIMLDELRDYRFYGPDMVHPSPLAADIIYDRFQQATMSPSTIQQAHNTAKQHKREHHIPIR